jgi:hypothetical protein
MSVLKRLYDKLHPAIDNSTHSTIRSRQEAQHAAEKASADLDAVRKRDTATQAVVASLKSQLDRNHFGELVEASMRRAA